jgi:hypothetical protein
MLALGPVLLAPASAAADPTVRFMGGTSGVLVTDPSQSGLSNLELDESLRADVKNATDKLDLRFDYMGRIGFVGLGLALRPDAYGNGNEQLLRELSATYHASKDLHLTVGRFATPGDFWLIADGAKVRYDYAPWLSQSVYGGLRAFTSGYQEALVSSDPTALGIAGTSLDMHTAISDSQVLFTWAMDRLDFSNQLSGATLVQEHHVEDGYFVQATSSVRPTRGTTLLGGVRFGTRYDTQFSAVTPFGATTIGTANLGSASAWELAEWAPEDLRGRLRFQYQFNFQKVTVYQAQLIGTGIGLGANGLPVSAADGDFQDHAFSVLARFHRAMRGDFGYRLRLRENGDREHHFVWGLRDAHLFGDFGYKGSLDLTIIDPATIFFAPTVRKFIRSVYALDLGYMGRYVDATIGVHYIDSIGSNMLSSQYAPPPSGLVQTQLFPFALDVDRVIVESLFYSGERAFFGVDLEESTVSWQVRALAQVGVVL